MSVHYVAVQWNRQKRIYDSVLAGGVALYLAAFVVMTRLLFPFITDEILIIRAFGSAAFVLLHVILCIGPLCRLDRRFLPLLYNRRHAGVTCFLLGLVHAVFVVITYHAGGDLNPFVSIFTSTPLRPAADSMPFQVFGFVALFILFLMAATSHDFWLANLTAPVWKALHMSVYFAYALLVMHVTFGVLQAERSLYLVAATAAGFLTVLGLHLFGAMKEQSIDHHCNDRNQAANRSLRSPSPRPSPPGRGGHGRRAFEKPDACSPSAAVGTNSVSPGQAAPGVPSLDDPGTRDSRDAVKHVSPLAPRERAGMRERETCEIPAADSTPEISGPFIDACAISDIPENRARIVCLSGERVAIFKYDGKISAVSNVCQHQNGPLGEGKIVFGCITCPWHGYQYQPEDGASPAPFIEKVPTFRVEIRAGRVWIDPRPLPAGTRVEPASILSADGGLAGTTDVPGCAGRSKNVPELTVKR